MANTPVWKGSKAMVEDPSSPIRGNNRDGATETRIFNGPFAMLAANIPNRLTTIQGSDRGLYVDTTKLEKLPGGRGKLTIELSANPFADPGSDTIELEWVEVQKPLEQHPRYRPGAGGAKELTDDDLDKIEGWKSAGTAALRASAYSKLTNAAQDFVDKLRRGTESYVVYSPVVRITTQSSSEPACGDCGVISTPSEGKPAGTYQWLKTADRRIRTNRLWQRVQEWTGAEYVDEDLY